MSSALWVICLLWVPALFVLVVVAESWYHAFCDLRGIVYNALRRVYRCVLLWK